MSEKFYGYVPEPDSAPHVSKDEAEDFKNWLNLGTSVENTPPPVRPDAIVPNLPQQHPETGTPPPTEE